MVKAVRAPSVSSVVLTVVGRFVSGRLLVFPDRTGATFLRADPLARRRGHRRSGAARLGRRLLVVAVLAAGVYGYVTAPVAVLWAAVVVVVAALATGLVLLIWAVVTFRHRHYERGPLWRKLAAEVKQLPESPNKGQYKVSRDMSTIRVVLPRSESPDQKRRTRLHNIVEDHTGRDYDAVWSLNARPPVVTWRRRPMPRPYISWPDFQTHITAAGPSEIVIAVDGRGDALTWDMDAEAPHLMASIGTGGGKSTFIRNLVVQLLRRGVERVVICDVKWTSAKSLEGVEGVEIYKDEGDIIGALRSVAATVDARKRGLADTAGRVVLIIEEGNMMTHLLTDWWARNKNQTDPKVCPAFADIATVMFCGREFSVNCVAVYQHGSVAAVTPSRGASGGTGLRAQFGITLFARFDPKAWKSVTGRPENTAPELPKGDDGEARAGAVVVYRSASRTHDLGTMPDLPHDMAHSEALAASGPATAVIPQVDPPRYNLKEASQDLGVAVVPLNYSNLKARKSRNPARWQGIGDTNRTGYTTYTREQLLYALALDDDEVTTS